MKLTTQLLLTVASAKPNMANITSIIVALDKFGDVLGLNQPHRFVQYGAQIAHESGGFRYDAELWGKDGGTAAQKRYEDRADLGHSDKVDGEAFKFRGRTGIQVTGRANYVAFTRWCKAKGFNSPDFEANPDAINTDPWEGLAPLWYWDTRKLNDYADAGDIEMITKRINGGMNGYAERLIAYETLGLAVLGYSRTKESIADFQRLAQSEGMLPAGDDQIDGDIGPKTRAAIHQQLVKRGTTPVLETKAAPVTEVIPVAPTGSDKKALNRVLGTVAASSTAFVGFVPADPYIRLALIGLAILTVILMVAKAEVIANRIGAALKVYGFGGD